MHEQSETVQLPNGRWANVYGGGLLKAGQMLPGSPTYATLDEAVAAARDRSLGHNETRSQDTPYAPYLLDVEPDSYKWGRMRAGMLPTDPMHAIVAPLEHREFVNESVKNNPASAVPLAGAIPLYTLLKALGMLPKGPNTSPASLDEIFAGYEGLFSGLKDNVRPKRKPKED